ncbi:MAG TPA: glycosyltransferase [Candidatus Acidoferrales bacterium]|nr:glycosyltransferase [Candidatus Acidoferrales bacterium]
MRVLTFTSLFPNSVTPNLGVFVHQRMAAFAALGSAPSPQAPASQEGKCRNEVEVIAPVPWAPPFLGGRQGRWRNVPAEELIGGIRVHHPRYPLLPKISMPFHARLMAAGSLELARRLHASRPFDLVDAHFIYPDGKAALRIANALGIPAVVSARGSDINLYPGFRLIRPQIRNTLLHSAGRVAVCEALREEMLRVAGEAALDIRVIGNGVDPSRFFPVPRLEARRNLQIPERARVLVSVAALLPVKGHELLLRGFERLSSAVPDVQLYLVGEGMLRPRLEQLTASLGLRDRVRFVGACPNVRLREWYSAADASVLASSREGWPNVVLESLACGTPVVATRVWGTPEILRSPGLGLLVDQTPESLAQGLQAALAANWDAANLVNYARTRTWAVVAQELENYFCEILAGRGKALL